jgi:hypothetical protein
MWEIRCVKVYDSERRGGLQYRRQELCPAGGPGDQAADHELLEAGVAEILARDEGWEPFAYSDGGVTMWLRRQVRTPEECPRTSPGSQAAPTA